MDNYRPVRYKIANNRIELENKKESNKESKKENKRQMKNKKNNKLCK